jgi:hypothetical protein
METKINNTLPVRKFRTTILICALSAVVSTVACSNKPKAPSKSQEPFGAKVQPVALKASLPVSAPMDVEKSTVVAKAPSSKLINFKSRDYGVSFVYPYQYAFSSARVLANADTALQPKSDGHNGQFPLARIDIPKGFYPDTNFDRGYFVMSLNQDLNQEECIATLGADAAKLQSESINGMDFRWMESEEGGRGNSTKTRNYAAYANGTCYELEMGVKTKNEQGLAREIDPDQVFRRLGAIAKTVKVAQSAPKTVVVSVESSAAAQETKN